MWWVLLMPNVIWPGAGAMQIAKFLQGEFQSGNFDNAATLSFEDINGTLSAIVSEDNENWQI